MVSLFFLLQNFRENVCHCIAHFFFHYRSSFFLFLWDLLLDLFLLEASDSPVHKIDRFLTKLLPLNPTTNGGMQNGSPVEICTRCTHVFRTLFAPICMLSRCLLTKFLHRSSVGSLLGVRRCWLGATATIFLFSQPFFLSSSCSSSSPHAFDPEVKPLAFLLLASAPAPSPLSRQRWWWRRLRRP